MDTIVNASIKTELEAVQYIKLPPLREIFGPLIPESSGQYDTSCLNEAAAAKPQTPPPSPQSIRSFSRSTSCPEPAYRIMKKRSTQLTTTTTTTNPITKSCSRDPHSRARHLEPRDFEQGLDVSRAKSETSCSSSPVNPSRGKELRTEKQNHFRKLEEILLEHGGLERARELHGGNKTTSRRKYEEIDILEEAGYLLEALAAHEDIRPRIRSILACMAWQRGKSQVESSF